MSEPTVYAKRLVKGSTIVYTALLITGIVGLLLRALLARALIAEDIALGVEQGYHYGLFYAVFYIVSVFGIFRNLGFGTALVKHIPEFMVKKRFDRIRSSLNFILLAQMTTGFLIAAFFFIFSDQIALAIIGTSAATPLFQIFGFWFILKSFYSITRAFEGLQNMLVFSLLKFLENASLLLVAFLLVWNLGLGVVGAAHAYLISVFAAAVVGYLILRLKYPQIFNTKAPITKPLAKKLSKFALPVFLTGSVGLVIGYMDTIMIAVFHSLPEVGYYQTAHPMFDFLSSISGAVMIVFFPMVSELWARGEKKVLSGMVHFIMKFSFIIITPAVLAFIAFPTLLISISWGSAYTPATVALQILGFATIFWLLTTILNHTLAGIGKPMITTRVIVAMAVFDFFANLLLIPTYGIEGAAAATLGTYVFGASLLLHHAKKFIKLSIPVFPLIKTAIGGALMLIFIFGLKSVLVLSALYEVTIVGASAVILYTVWILSSRTVTKSDLSIIPRVLPLPARLVRIASKFVRD